MKGSLPVSGAVARRLGPVATQNVLSRRRSDQVRAEERLCREGFMKRTVFQLFDQVPI